MMVRHQRDAHQNRVFELMADRLQVEARMMHEAIDEIDALRTEVRRLRKEILAARQEGRPREGYWLKLP